MGGGYCKKKRCYGEDTDGGYGDNEWGYGDNDEGGHGARLDRHRAAR